MSASMEDLFGPVIDAYTRGDAVADGVLIDATEEPWAELTNQLWPGTDVCMSAGVRALIRQAVENPRHMNDDKGVWWDILIMSRSGLGETSGPTRLFPVIVTGLRDDEGEVEGTEYADGEHPDEQTLKVVISGEGRWPDPNGRPTALTYLLENED